MKRVKATREGLVGHRAATGWVVDRIVSACALPSTKALYRHVRIINPQNARATIAEVLDVGPWNEHDDAYVFGDAPPAAEVKPHDTRGRFTNRAGIDLSERVWHDLGMTDNAEVLWEFIT